ncbi:hypothetical protein [Aneurinibacillus thermoaerophilus]|uniref:hypothetical protein n=1 Tax=Aneurinibacillus thermoaerophilus TaxID=143495 RepID=UPI002E1A2401|nr:hypothetical protein [Aneurinibacillus thermoaerophilus]
MNAISIEASFLYDKSKAKWEESLLKSGWKKEGTIFRKFLGEFVLFSKYKERSGELMLGCARVTNSLGPIMAHQLPLFKLEDAWEMMFQKDTQPHSIIIKMRTDYTGCVLSPEWNEVSDDPVTHYNEHLQVCMIKHGEYVPPYAPAEVERTQYFEFIDENPGRTTKYLQRLSEIGFPILLLK